MPDIYTPCPDMVGKVLQDAGRQAHVEEATVSKDRPRPLTHRVDGNGYHVEVSVHHLDGLGRDQLPTPRRPSRDVSRPVRLGVLDFSDLGLQETIDLAAQAEALGYARYWLAEHHDSGVHANALMMTLAVAAVTDTIRVGPAGVLLRFQSPLHIANSALLLAALFGGRIDLGLAAGSASPAVAAALLDGRVGTEADDYFDTKVRRLLRLLRHEEQVKPSPQGVDAPPVWILGSSGSRASLAGQEGVGYCLSLFHSPHLPPANVLTQYRESFTPSGALDRPTCSVAVCVVCGESEAEAQRRRQTCRNPFIQHCLAGTPEQCLEQLLTVCATYQVGDVVVLDGCPTFAERLYSLGLLAEACQLPGVESHHV